MSLAFALPTVALLPRTPTRCISERPLHLYPNVTPWWMLYLNVSIFAARESGPSTADAARMKAGARTPGVPLKHFVGLHWPPCSPQWSWVKLCRSPGTNFRSSHRGAASANPPCFLRCVSKIGVSLIGCLKGQSLLSFFFAKGRVDHRNVCGAAKACTRETL